LLDPFCFADLHARAQRRYRLEIWLMLFDLVPISMYFSAKWETPRKSQKYVVTTIDELAIILVI